MRSEEQKILQEALMEAIAEGKTDSVITLLQQGADPNSNFSGCPALAMAIVLNHTEIALQLLTAGAKINIKIKNQEGEDANILAACLFNPNREVVSKLLEQNVDLNEVIEGDPKTKSYLNITLRLWQWFALMGHKDIVKLFIEKYSSSLALDTPSEFTILELLQPKKSTNVQTLYKRCLIKFEESLKDPELQQGLLLFHWYNVIKLASDAEEQGKANAVTEAMEDLLLNMPEKDVPFFEAYVDEDYRVFLKIAAITVPAMRLHKTFGELFRGESTLHVEIAQIIENAQKKPAIQPSVGSIFQKPTQPTQSTQPLHLEKPKEKSASCCNSF